MNATIATRVNAQTQAPQWLQAAFVQQTQGRPAPVAVARPSGFAAAVQPSLGSRLGRWIGGLFSQSAAVLPAVAVPPSAVRRQDASVAHFFSGAVLRDVTPIVEQPMERPMTHAKPIAAPVAPSSSIDLPHLERLLANGVGPTHRPHDLVPVQWTASLNDRKDKVIIRCEAIHTGRYPGVVRVAVPVTAGAAAISDIAIAAVRMVRPFRSADGAEININFSTSVERTHTVLKRIDARGGTHATALQPGARHVVGSWTATEQSTTRAQHFADITIPWDAADTLQPGIGAMLRAFADIRTAAPADALERQVFGLARS